MFLKITTTSYSLELFLWMLGSFLIGYLFAMFYYSNKNNISATIIEPTKLATDVYNEQEEFVIRAKKTVERGGIEIKELKQLNFNNIGKATEEDKNDLTKIKGVGAFIEEKLNNIGIYTYKQIANLSDNDIDIITDLIQFFPGRIKRDDWKEQAKNLLSDK